MHFMARNGLHKNKRQAVVIIHGMGEQRPMDTLRSFVKGIKFWIQGGKYDKDGQPLTWSRPDGISEMYETRRITMQYHGGNTKTDFYEFYWAHHMRDTSWDHMIPWLKKLLTAPSDEVPPRLKRLRLRVRILLVVIPILVLAFFIFVKPWGQNYFQNIFTNAVLLAAIALIGKFILWVIRFPFSQLLLNTAGDAARYFNPMPSNIEERSTIRREGIAFLKKLHENPDVQYDRIMVVGPSLGSVVAYDMIRLLWHEMFSEFSNPVNPDHDVFKEMDAMAAKVANDEMTTDEMMAYQDLQHKCWEQYRLNGNRWLITDFITIAGAIAHTDFYLLGKEHFSDLVRQKEFPVCPPILEGKDVSVLFGDVEIPANPPIQPTKISVKPLHHAAPFAITRWTNIFFSSDYVGGPARRVFRCGVKDIEIKKYGNGWTPGGHTNYWDAEGKNEALLHIAKAMGFKQLNN
jgi:hypothetical protein